MVDDGAWHAAAAESHSDTLHTEPDRAADAGAAHSSADSGAAHSSADTGADSSADASAASDTSAAHTGSDASAADSSAYSCAGKVPRERSGLRCQLLLPWRAGHWHADLPMPRQ